MANEWQKIRRLAGDIGEKMYDIEFFRSILDGTCTNPEYQHVDKDQVANRLKSTQEELLDDLKYIGDGRIATAIEWVKKNYCAEEKK